MTKWSIQIEGDFYEDSEDFRLFSSVHEIYNLLFDVKQKLRSRLKYEEIPEKEYNFIDEIYTQLCIIE